MKRRVAFATLGCKANQFDTHVVEDQIAGRVELVDFEAEADVYVINTCTVTHRGDADARKLIRRAHRRNPRARIIVTGCYAQTQPEAVAGIEGVSLVVGNSHKDRLPELILADGPAPDPLAYHAPLGFTEQPPLLPALRRRRGGTRAFVKIQDGCDYACSFCIITIARGANRSVPVAQLVEEIAGLTEQGVQEVVLTGVQIGRWGRDLAPRQRLVDLLEALLARTRVPRIRITAIDPREVDPALIELVAAEPRICPHLHVPVQSGDDVILQLMRRNYTRRDLIALFERIRERIPDCLIGTDVIVGFPGEGPSEFDMTVDLVERWIDHVHVFSYSDRLGTPAAELPEKVHPEVIKRRSAILRRLGERKRRAFAERLVGTRQRVLVEAGLVVDGGGRWYTGYTDHYVPVRIPADSVTPDTLVEAHLVASPQGIVARVD